MPADQLVGGVEGQGLKQANAVFGYTRLMVGAFGLGVGQAAARPRPGLRPARASSSARRWSRSRATCSSCWSQPWIDLAAGRAYVDEIALRIDSRRARPAGRGLHRQALVHRGRQPRRRCRRAGARRLRLQRASTWSRRYRRDVRITTIYEGTSEIQQSIIAHVPLEGDRARRRRLLRGARGAGRRGARPGARRRAPALAAAALRGVNDVILAPPTRARSPATRS